VAKMIATIEPTLIGLPAVRAEAALARV
jgi:hypothetical protein